MKINDNLLLLWNRSGREKKNILIAINFMGALILFNIIQYSSSSVILFGEFTRVEHVQR